MHPVVNNRKAFFASKVERYGKLFILFKHTIEGRDGNYYTPHKNNKIIFDTDITVSDRESTDLTFNEQTSGIVNKGLHMYTYQPRAFWLQSYVYFFRALVHEDDFVAYDAVEQAAVFMRAIYTKQKPPGVMLSVFETALEEKRCACA